MGKSIDTVLMFHLSGNGLSTTPRKIEIDEAITQDVALEKLAALLAVEPVVRTIACPLFDKTAATLFGASSLNDNERREIAKDQFDTFVEDTYEYPYSNELVSYGATPEFDAVYADPTQRMSTFFAALLDATKAVSVKHGQTGGWRLLK